MYIVFGQNSCISSLLRKSYTDQLNYCRPLRNLHSHCKTLSPAQWLLSSPKSSDFQTENPIMKMRKFTKHAVYDYMHRGIVISMMGITCVGCVMLGLHTYRFFKYVRPLQQEQKRLLAEEKLVQEQNEQEAELLRRQKEAEGL